MIKKNILFVKSKEQLKTFQNYKHFVPNYEQDVKDISQLVSLYLTFWMPFRSKCESFAKLVFEF